MNFIKVADTSEFATKRFKCFRYLAKTIAIFKTGEGEFYAIEADCKHQNANLLVSGLKGDVVTCARHGWQYNMVTGECLTEAWAALRKYPLKIEGTAIYVSPKPIEPSEDDWEM
jgi:nitrite reductase (NADH) small subunit